MYRVHWLHCLNSWINIGNMTPNSWNTSNSHGGQSLDIPQHLLMVTVLADCHIFAGWALKRISGPQIVMARLHIAQTLLFHYDFNVSYCLFGFYCQNTWCQDQAIKSFSSSHGCRRQPGLQNCGVHSVWRGIKYPQRLKLMTAVIWFRDSAHKWRLIHWDDQQDQHKAGLSSCNMVSHLMSRAVGKQMNMRTLMNMLQLQTFCCPIRGISKYSWLYKLQFPKMQSLLFEYHSLLLSSLFC